MRPARQKRGKKKTKQRKNGESKEDPVLDMMGAKFIDRVMTEMETYPPHDALGITKSLRQKHTEYKAIHLSEFNQHVQNVITKITGGAGLSADGTPFTESGMASVSETSGSAAVTPEQAAAKPLLPTKNHKPRKVGTNNMNSRLVSQYKKSRSEEGEFRERDGMLEVNANVHTVSQSGHVAFMPKRAKDRLRALEAARHRQRSSTAAPEHGGGFKTDTGAMSNFDELQMTENEFSRKRKRQEPAISTDSSTSQENGTGSNINSQERPEMKEIQLKKRRRTAQVEFITGRGYADLGGIEHVLSDIRELIEWPLQHPEIYSELGVEPPRGILLHGPPGCGKTLLATSVAGELGVPFLKISAPEIVSGMSGESEAKLRGLFKDAMSTAPALVFIDEIDAITPKRETAMREMERRIVAQLLTCMDDLTLDKMDGNAVIVIGATNRPDALDPALRRAGRFDREISMGIPDEKARASILKVITSKMKLDGTFDYKEIARKTPGFVGADLNALAKEAAVIAVKRIFSSVVTKEANAQNDENSTDAENIKDKEHSQNEEMMETEENTNSEDVAMQSSHSPAPNNDDAASTIEQNTTDISVSDHIKSLKTTSKSLNRDQLDTLAITMNDFLVAVKKVQPSSLREGFTTIPNVSWVDVGAMSHVREELDIAIVEAIKHPEKYEMLGLTGSAGVLLYGPPGCGKTLVAKAIANESGANFISIKGPELLNKYVGESERAVRQVFARGQASAPCVVFFDELDALCPRRSESSNQSTERVVNQLLTCMDGLEPRRQVFVIAATNRPDIIDPAMLRPGRLDKMLYVPLPTRKGREEILQAQTRKVPMSEDVNLEAIAKDHRSEGFSGADLAALVREASLCALRESLRLNDDNADHLKVKMAFFQEALHKVAPSVTEKDRKMYDKMQSKLRKVRAELNKKKVKKESPSTSSSPRDDEEPAMQVN